ncbi:MAG: Holliday junction resolvase [Treponema sp.]|nr:Holliday junction resolvase [Treponema sp.]
MIRKSIFIQLIKAVPKSTLVVALVCLILVFIIIRQKIKFASKLKKERADAVNRSRAVINGQMTEQVAAFLPDFPCNPSDVRFIGKPVDFIGFPGLGSSNSVKEVLLIEVKTGVSNLSGREKEIKKAVDEGRVRYVEYRAP